MALAVPLARFTPRVGGGSAFHVGHMSTPLNKFGIWFVILAVVVLVVCFFPQIRSPVVKDTPMLREISAMHDIGTKLRCYADEHQTLPGGEQIGKSPDSLVAAGILSLDDATYIREHHIEFRGFDPSRIGSNIIVMETVITNTDKIPCRIAGYSDGSVVRYDLHKTP